MIKQEFTAEEARTIGEQIGIDWEQIPIEEFRRGLAVELERSGMRSDDTIVTAEDLLAAGKVAGNISKQLQTITPVLNILKPRVELRKKSIPLTAKS